MFEELNQHRAAVAEQIQKACEIGFTGNELEKAHKVGDIHPNGKWVWTQLPSGKYDWRVIKKKSAGSGASAPSTAQKTAQDSKSWDNLSNFYKMNSDEARLWAHWNNFIKSGDPYQVSSMRKILETKFPNIARWKQTSPNTGNVKLIAVDGDDNEVASIELSGKSVDLPKLQTFMDKCSAVKAVEKKKEMSFDEAKKLGKPDISTVNSYKVPTTLYGIKRDLEDLRGKGNYSGVIGKIKDAEIDLRNALKLEVGGKGWNSVDTEENKAKRIRAAANKLATYEELAKRIGKVQSDLNKMKKDFLANTNHDFTEKEISEWLNKYNTADDPAAVVRNTWKYAMGRIGSTSLTISVGKSGKEKPFSTSRWDGTVPSWRPIGIMTYTIPSYRGWGNKDTEIRVPIQSWDDIVKHQSDTESYTIYLYKHPKQ